MNKSSIDDDTARGEAAATQRPPPKAKPTTKAERRALQEAQRAAKAAKKTDSQSTSQAKERAPQQAPPRPVAAVQKTTAPSAEKKKHGESKDNEVATFGPLKHLRMFSPAASLTTLESVAAKNIHSKFRKFGEKLITDELNNSNEKCRELLEAIAALVEDFKTPKVEDFSRAFLRIFENHMAFLDSCRPLTVNMLNCSSYFKGLLAQMVHVDEAEARETLISSARKYYEERIQAARRSILEYLTSKEHNLIADGDTVMIIGCSSSALEVVNHLIDQRVKFKLVMCHVNRISESLLTALEEKKQDCLHVSLNDVVYLTNKISKVIVPGMVLYANGNAVTTSGYAQALEVMHKRGVPSIVLCETYKFVDDAITSPLDRNELFNLEQPSAPSRKRLCSVQLTYDLVNPSYITYLVCEKGVLPSTSSSAVSRLKFPDNPLVVQ